MTKEMKSLNGYEIVDSTARDRITALENSKINPNLIQSNSEWISWKPTTGINICTLIAIFYIPDYIKSGTIFTISIELKWENFASESGKTLDIHSQGSVDNSWDYINIFSYGFVNDFITKSGQRIFTKTNIKWDGLHKKYEIGIRCDNSNGNGILYYRNLKIEQGPMVTPYIPKAQNQILSGSSTPSNDYGSNEDFYIMY